MLSAGAVVAGAPHNEPLLRAYDFDEPLIYQIVGAHPSIMADACSILADRGCNGVDINMGCPNHEIVKKGQGARLLADIGKAREIIRACRKVLTVSLSVKLRTGYENNDEKQFVTFIRMLEDEGVDFIAVHPRYAKLSFRRLADWRFITLAKQSVSIPVIGNGDIVSPDTAIEKMLETGCDGIMIGREAVKSPWIFHLIDCLIKGCPSALTVNFRDIFITTLSNMRDYLPERLHKSRSHRFSIYFSKNACFGHELFKKIRMESSIELIQEIVDDYYRRNPEEVIKEFRVGNGSTHDDGTPLPVHHLNDGCVSTVR